MAYSTTDTTALRDAMLRMWTPVVGARSFYEVVDGNADKIINDYGKTGSVHLMLRDNLPFRPIFPFLDEFSDEEPPFEIEKEILAGSWSEGLYMYGHSNSKIPDTDYMLVIKNISFSQEDQRCGNLALKEDTPFVHAYLTDEDAIKLWGDFLADHDDERGKRLSSKKLKERLNKNYSKSYLVSFFGNSNFNDVDDGAAININRIQHYEFGLKFADNMFGETYLSDIERVKKLVKETKDFTRELLTFTGWDIVLAISCEGWPSCAKEWITRDRKWPHDELLHKITHDGFHIVPKKSSKGDFRLSFSFAETSLIENLTELQHKVLRFFKAIVKYHQNSWSPHIKEIITTYHLKTIAFWHFERLTQDSITEQTVVTHLILLLRELAEALRVRELPMYFMPMVNLFENVENPEDAFDIGEQIEKLSNDFPRLIKGIENITSWFSRSTCFAQNIIEKISDFKDRRDPKRKESSTVPNPFKERVQKAVSASFDNIRERGKYLNLMTNMQFSPQNWHQTDPGF